MLASFVPRGSVVADIGTDHGYLPVFLVSQGISPGAVAADINSGPLEAARSNIRQNGLANKIDTRLGNGLTVLKPGEADCIVIAGMGGGTIRDILSASPQVALTASRLVLQPMADEGELRTYLINHGWRISAEELLLEDGRLYLILVAEKGTEAIDDPLYLEIGPRLLENKHPLLRELISKLELKYTRILDGLAKSSSSQAREKEVNIKVKLASIGQLLKELQPDGQE